MADPTPNLIRATVNLPQVLVSNYLSSSVETVYQVPNAKSTVIATATVCNNSDAPRTVNISVVKSGGSPTSGNRVAIITLRAGESCIIEEIVGLLMGPGDGIAAGAGASSAVSITLTGAVSS
ncbi:hypothetical protein [Mycolicibacterium gilvum]|uniref:hypothetical protein n=1 Tax=Mycolicibacterium gilvum TaxID=1804 RepID=UPI0040459257